MKVAGTFDTNVLFNRRNAGGDTKKSDFAAMLAINLDRKPGEEDVTALFGSNSSELAGLYEQMTGKSLNENENNTIVFTLCRHTAVNGGYWAGEFLDDSEVAYDEVMFPVKSVSSNRNMKYAIR